MGRHSSIPRKDATYVLDNCVFIQYLGGIIGVALLALTAVPSASQKDKKSRKVSPEKELTPSTKVNVTNTPWRGS